METKMVPSESTKKAIKIISSLLFAIIFIVILANSITFQVKFGSIAVLTRFGKIVGEPQQAGLHFKIPFIDKPVFYRTQKIVYETVDPEVIGVDAFDSYNSLTVVESQSGYKDIAVDTTTKDGQQISVRYTVRFSINPEKIKEIANTLGTEAEVVDKIVKTDSRIWSRNIPRNYSALDLYTGNIDNISEEIEEKLRPIFESNGLILDKFGIRSISFGEDYISAIEQKQIEKEKITIEEYIAQQEEYKKQAQITKAQGEAEAQKLQQQTLTDSLIKKMWIEKWNGVLPTTTAGSDGNFLINLK